MAYVPDSQIQANVDAAAKLGVAIPGVGGKITPVAPITANSLSGGATPAQTSPVPDPTLAPSLQSYFTSFANANQDAYTNALTSGAQSSESSYLKAFQDFVNAQSGAQGQTSLTNNEYSAVQPAYGASVDTLSAKLNDQNLKLLEEQKNLRDQVNVIRQNKTGQFRSGVEGDIQRAQSESLDRQANLAILQMKAKGDYEGAKAIADRAVAAKYEADQNKINTLGIIFKANSDLFTTREARLFDALQADRQNSLDLQKQKDLIDYKAKIDAQNATPKAPTLQNFGTATNPDFRQYNPQTGQWEAPSGYTPTSPSTQQETGLLNDITSAINNPLLSSTFGGVLNNPLGVAQRNIQGSASYTYANQIDNIISQLALAARGQLKGQGQVSDFEGRLLSKAQTSLTIGTNPTDAKRELAQIRGAILTSSGKTVAVKITDPKTKQSSVIYANQAGIQQAVDDGLTVEYQ